MLSSLERCPEFRGSVLSQGVPLPLHTYLELCRSHSHSYFRYNNASLGLCLLAVTAVCCERDILGSILFSLALNYKQMELYHSVPFFCYLLGKSLKKPSWYISPSCIALCSRSKLSCCLYYLMWSALEFDPVNTTSETLHSRIPMMAIIYHGSMYIQIYVSNTSFM